MESIGDIIFNLERPLTPEIDILPLPITEKAQITSKQLKIDSECLLLNEKKTVIAPLTDDVIRPNNLRRPSAAEIDRTIEKCV